MCDIYGVYIYKWYIWYIYIRLYIWCKYSIWCIYNMYIYIHVSSSFFSRVQRPKPKGTPRSNLRRSELPLPFQCFHLSRPRWLGKKERSREKSRLFFFHSWKIKHQNNWRNQHFDHCLHLPLRFLILVPDSSKELQWNASQSGSFKIPSTKRTT